jgi:AraC-like DNA-binding protein
LTPVVINLFAELRVGAAINTTRDQWHPFHTCSSITEFEFAYGVAPARWAYNERSFHEARKRKAMVIGEHAGFSDLFVPVHAAGELRGMLVCGPFATSRPTSVQVLQRWRALTDSSGRLSDPGFSAYLAATLSTLTLDAPKVRAFQGLLRAFADLLVRRGSAEKLTAEIGKYRRILVEARHTERMWETARAMVDERSARMWDAHGQLAPIGMKELPTRVVVGFLLDQNKRPDPVDALLRRDAFQRACVELARKVGGTASGKIGAQGVTFLAERKGSQQQARVWLTDLALRARKLAREHGLSLHAGISQSTTFEHLPARYHEALRAAEKAVSSGLSVVYGEPQRERSSERLRLLRAALGRTIEERPKVLSARFDRYVEAVLAHSGYRIESTRAELEAGLERLTEPLLAQGLLDEKSSRELHRSLERSTDGATTVAELVASYRRCISEIEAALAHPVRARQARGTERALTFVRENLSEPLELARVAKVAGFAPDHFSVLFKREQGMTFVRYVLEARIEQAKSMLGGTRLSVDQIQDLCGFHNRTYFHRAFKRLVGKRPAEYRAQQPELNVG